MLLIELIQFENKINARLALYLEIKSISLIQSKTAQIF